MFTIYEEMAEGVRVWRRDHVLHYGVALRGIWAGLDVLATSPPDDYGFALRAFARFLSMCFPFA
jgi:hypothetical protein